MKSLQESKQLQQVLAGATFQPRHNEVADGHCAPRLLEIPAAISLQKQEAIHPVNIAMEGDAKFQNFLLDSLKHDIVHLDKEQQNSPRSL